MQTTRNARLTLRLPHSLKATLIRAAKKNNRSLNSEVLARLTTSATLKPIHAVAENKRRYRFTSTDHFTHAPMDMEKKMLLHFRRCHPEAQEAILKIIKATHSLTP